MFWFQRCLPRFVVISVAVMLLHAGCDPIEVRIVGRFQLDEEVGCETCPTLGPITMMFEGGGAAGGSPRYRFDHANGEGHAGTYVFEAVDTTRSSLVLYPDSTGSFHADLLNEAILTDYVIKAGRITTSCGSGIRRCLWRKE